MSETKKIIFNVVFQYSDNCNWLDRFLLSEKCVMELYSKAADVFNDCIDDWNNEFDALYPDHGDMKEGDGMYETYNRFIQEKMIPQCERITKDAHLGIGIRPTIEPWYEFYVMLDERKTCTFYLKEKVGEL